MASIVHELKKQLEDRGEQVVLANLDTGWFAVNANTWRTRVATATRNGREGPNLVVYRTKFDEARDHYVIPHAMVRALLTEDTLKQQGNGTYRWNLTLVDGMLHVTHRIGVVDVREWRAAPLIVEKTNETEAAEFEEAVQVSRLDRQGRITRLAKAPRQPERSYSVTLVFKRNPDVVAEVLERANGNCERCQAPAPFTRASDGTPYLEVHHKIKLASGGEDTVENAIALCPNCHRREHFG